MLEVPDDTNVTPYIEPRPVITRSTCRPSTPRGEPIANANFQTPADAEYNGLAALLSVPLGPDGRPQQCVIVRTASARNVRGVDFDDLPGADPARGARRDRAREAGAADARSTSTTP